MPATTLPDQLGRYRILKKLGEGGMGAVYLAEDSRLHRQVALKVPHFAADEDPKLIDRFYREARLASQVTHNNLCPVFDVDCAEGVHYLTMAYIEGTPLSHLVSPERLWPVDRAVEVVRQVAGVLQILHERGIIHRDLKPANVMIRRDGVPVLMDFGLARCYASESRRVTSQGQALGTPAYMSPEQITADELSMGPASDVWALGVMLYELVVGRVPFEGTTFVELGMHILHAEPVPPSTRRPGIDPRLDAICCHALAKAPGERPQSMQEFIAILDQLRQGDPIGSGSMATWRPSPPLPTPLQPTLPTGRQKTRELPRLPAPGRRRWVVGGIAAASLVVLTLAAWLVGGASNRGDSPGPDTAPGSGTPTTEMPPGRPPRVTNSLGMEMVLLPAGRFTMGSPAQEAYRNPDEGPQHGVEISKAFYMGVHEVTQAEYRKVTGKNPSWFSAGGKGAALVQGLDTDRFPVEEVKWEDAVAFCQALSERPAEKEAGRTYRLPTEAEWEYACRAGSTEYRVFHFGNRLSSQDANFDGDYPYGGADAGPDLARPCPVGSYPANAWGLHDLHGNVWEWCSDWYAEDYYGSSPRRDPPGAKLGEIRILRGGSWANNGWDCRSAYRDRDDVADRLNRVGFRVVCVIARTPAK